MNSNIRLTSPRVFFARGQGARLWDVDGNDYVDYLLGQGPNILGHAHPGIHRAVAEATELGMVFGAQHPLEIEAAEKFLAAVGWPETVRFGVSGTESIQAALRVARAATGRRLVIRFAGHYHGWLDDLLTAFDPQGRPTVASKGQLGDRLLDSVVVDWNDASALEQALAAHHGQVAAVLMEPIMLNQGSMVPQPGYLETVRALCDAHGAVLIFDEVITGFRVGLAGAAGWSGVTPDLAVYGKAVAGGWPVSALAGRRELLEPVGTGTVNMSGTFNGSVMAMAAVSAVMSELVDSDPYPRMADVGESLKSGLRECSARYGLPLHVQGLPQAFHVSWGDRDGCPLLNYRDVTSQDVAAYHRLADALVDSGVWVSGRGIWFVSAAHDPTTTGDTIDRVDAAFARWSSQ